MLGKGPAGGQGKLALLAESKGKDVVCVLWGTLSVYLWWRLKGEVCGSH